MEEQDDKERKTNTYLKRSTADPSNISTNDRSEVDCDGRLVFRVKFESELERNEVVVVVAAAGRHALLQIDDVIGDEGLGHRFGDPADLKGETLG